MPRTTLDIDPSVLRELKRIAKEEGKSLGRVVSEVAAQGLTLRKQRPARGRTFRWTARAMSARVDLDDRDAVYEVLDRS